MPDERDRRAADRGGPPRPSRGLVAASWILWPLFVAAVNLWLAPGGQCVGDQDCPQGTTWWEAALWVAAAVLPGTILLAMRRRADRAGDAGRAPR